MRFGTVFLGLTSLLLPQSEQPIGWTYADSFRIKFVDSGVWYGGAESESIGLPDATIADEVMTIKEKAVKAAIAEAAQ